MVAVHVGDQEPADVAHAVPQLLQRGLEDLARLRDGPAAVDQDEPVAGLDDVDVDRAQAVHRQRQRESVDAGGDLVGTRLGPLPPAGAHLAWTRTSPRPVIGGRSLAKTRPPGASHTACTALTSRIAVTIIPETLWSPSRAVVGEVEPHHRLALDLDPVATAALRRLRPLRLLVDVGAGDVVEDDPRLAVDLADHLEPDGAHRPLRRCRRWRSRGRRRPAPARRSPRAPGRARRSRPAAIWRTTGPHAVVRMPGCHSIATSSSGLPNP